MPGTGERGEGSFCLMGIEFRFCKMKKEFWRWMVVIVAQKYECLLIALNCTFRNG